MRVLHTKYIPCTPGGRGEESLPSWQDLSKGDSEVYSERCSVLSDSDTLWTVACQAPLSMGFCRQEYWSGLPFPSPGELPNSGTKPPSPALQADSLLSETPGKPKEVVVFIKQAKV